MPMGLTNASAIFMCTMNNLFLDMLDKGVVGFLDNILIYSNSVEEHFEILKSVLTHLCKHAFYCKMKICSFF